MTPERRKRKQAAFKAIVQNRGNMSLRRAKSFARQEIQKIK